MTSKDVGSRAMGLIQARYVRWALALVIVAQAVDLLFATVLTLAYRLHYPGIAGFLGGFTPGDDYRRLIPLMDATPWWLHALWVAASALSLTAAWRLLRRRPSALLLFVAAWALGVIGDLVSRSMPAYREVFSSPARQLIRDFLIPAARAVVPAFVAAALWTYGGRAPAKETVP